jgi:hypothetical protein
VLSISSRPALYRSSSLDLISWLILWTLEITAICGLFINSIDGALPQAEIALLGNVPIPSYLWLIAEICALSALAFLSGRVKRSHFISVSYVFLYYLLIQAFYLLMAVNLAPRDIFWSHFTYILPLLLAIGVEVFSIHLSEKRIQYVALLFLIPCLYFSLLQFATGRPILPTESADGHFSVASWQFVDGVSTRAFSLFASGFMAGMFYCLFVSIAVGMFFRRGYRWLTALLIVLSAIACYATLTRLVMIGFVCCFLMAIALQFLRSNRVRIMLPLVSACFALLVLARGILATTLGGGKDLSNSDSLLMRLIGWRSYIEMIRHMRFLDAVFGVGMITWTPVASLSTPPNAAPMSIDNGYLLIVLHLGIAGLAVLAAVYWAAWKDLLAKCKDGGPITVGCAAFWAVIPFFCLFNDPIQGWGAALLLGFATYTGSATVTQDHVNRLDQRQIAGRGSMGALSIKEVD